jgi:predicted phosphodiesterase
MTLLAVVSDIHGNLPALQAVVDDATARGATAFLDLGDTVSGPLWPEETAAWIAARGWPGIAGNHERQVLTQPQERQSATDRITSLALSPASRAWLASRPPTLRPAPGLWVVHGTPGSDLHYLLETVVPGHQSGHSFGRDTGLREATDDELRERLGPVPDDVTLLLCGHSHLPRHRRLPLGRRGLQIVNPGSVGLPAYDDDHPLPHVVETGDPRARYALLAPPAASGDGWGVTLCAVPYDAEAAARRAEANGRGDWADALRTGRVGRRERDVTRAG